MWYFIKIIVAMSIIIIVINNVISLIAAIVTTSYRFIFHGFVHGRWSADAEPSAVFNKVLKLFDVIHCKRIVCARVLNLSRAFADVASVLAF